MLADALRHFTAAGNEPSGEYVPWVITPSAWEQLVLGRRSQFEVHSPLTTQQHSLQLSDQHPVILEHTATSPTQFPQHAAYLIPYTTGAGDNKEFVVVWRHALCFLVAVSGSERLLDSFVETMPRGIPFKEQWSIRSVIPLPLEIWDWIEELFRVARTGHESDKWLEMTNGIQRLLEQTFVNQALILPDDFHAELCDVSLRNSWAPEYPCAIQRRGSTPNNVPVIHFEDPKRLQNEVVVRIAQLTTHTSDVWKDFPKRFPSLKRSQMQTVSRQVAYAFERSIDGNKPDIIVFPEVCLPPVLRPFFESLVAESECAGIIGCMWRVEVNAMPCVRDDSRDTKYFVNEALVAFCMGRLGIGKPLVRSFLVRKPVPAHVELALAKHLSDLAGREGAWRILAGRRLFRFVHPLWGDFAVAICSDLVDSAPWIAVRGYLLHIFMCSYNQDVALFDSLTWVRAYESFANLVATNCGEYGGSYAWSPKKSESKEIARIRGAHCCVIADVRLPVRELFDWQKDGVGVVIMRHVSEWSGNDVNSGKLSFKSPPPSFTARQEISTSRVISETQSVEGADNVSDT
jgi:hypothetical protein